jgi:S-adenosylmethionine:diacylglycerol 3-amino-3-carboxypropyl transferase
MLEVDLTQSILESVVGHMPSGGRLAYCTLLEPNKQPSKATLEKLTYLEEFSTELQKRDRMILYSGFHVFSVSK